MSQQLYEKLKEYGRSEAYPFHMPGHKRRLGMPEEILDIDITEIDGFDNLHHAEGVLKEAQERAAKLYGSDETFFLVNGSTAGILAAISACTAYGGKLLMARNCHKAAYHAAELRGLHTVYVYPQYAAAGKSEPLPGAGIGPDGEAMLPGAGTGPDGEAMLPGAGTGPDGEAMLPGAGISPEAVRKALERDHEIQAVFITSPTYEGIVSDVGRIAEITHSFGVPLIVDEAHGAHFGFHPYFPESSVKKGADIVIHSLHKTLPSMTQTALLHRNGTLVKSERVRKYLGMYQTSSPSYVFMAGMDACIGLLEKRSETLFADFAEKLKKFSEDISGLKYIHLYRKYGADPSKLVLWADGKSGKWLSGQLRGRFHLEMEMEAGGYVIALTSIADTQEGFDRLSEALTELDGELEGEKRTSAGTKRCGTSAGMQKRGSKMPPGNRQALTIAETDECRQEEIFLEDSEGKISAEYIYLYPPGIPLIVPGEEISRELLRYLADCREAGLSLQGLEDFSGKKILVVSDEMERGILCDK